MFSEEGHIGLVAARLKDYFGRRTPWQRRIWNVGSALLLSEVLEAAQMHRTGHVSKGSLEDLAATASVQLGRDPGIGNGPIRSQIQGLLRGNKVTDDRALNQLAYLKSKISDSYLKRWQDEIARGPTYGIEFISRSLGSHLLDSGFSAEHLYRWLEALEHEDRTLKLEELLEEAEALIRRTNDIYQVLVPLTHKPKGANLPANWLSAQQVAQWLTEHAGSPEGIRQAGGFLFEVPDRDPWAAVEQVRNLVRSISARVAVGLPGRSELQSLTRAWVKGREDFFPFHLPRRQVDVHTLSRENALFGQDLPGLSEPISSALELLASLETGTPGTAVASGWAAVEALLSTPGAANVTAADSLGALVACSISRAELTTISYRYAKDRDDAVAEQLERCEANRDRALVMAHAILNGDLGPIEDLSDQAAVVRLEEILTQPRNTLKRVARYAGDAFRRLYRQRNLVLHAAKTESVALQPTLRTVPPLVGAGVDRIVHGALANPPVSSRELVARAFAEIDLAGTDGGVHVVDLLGV